ncbi:light-inducible protein CPRF2-like [Panicum virgatum]|nr:light-inducible protein CPRF2-like [Panicum virgatum]
MVDGIDDEVVELPCGRGGAFVIGLKRRLDLYCAAVAKSMEAKSQESSLGYSDSKSSCTSKLTSQASSDVGHTRDGGGATLVTNSNVIGHDDYQRKPSNSGTSKELSEGGVNLEEKSEPANAKKMRRMLLNRESARRSRKRRETHLRNLESQVSRLTSENASLLKCMADMTEKYKNATVDNRNLIIAAETMRTEVNIAEEAVRRLSGTTFLLSSTSELPGSMTLSSLASDVASPAIGVEDSMEHFLQGATLHDDHTACSPKCTNSL